MRRRLAPSLVPLLLLLSLARLLQALHRCLVVLQRHRLCLDSALLRLSAHLQRAARLTSTLEAVRIPVGDRALYLAVRLHQAVSLPSLHPHLQHPRLVQQPRPLRSLVPRRLVPATRPSLSSHSEPATLCLEAPIRPRLARLLEEPQRLQLLRLVLPLHLAHRHLLQRLCLARSHQVA